MMLVRRLNILAARVDQDSLGWDFALSDGQRSKKIKLRMRNDISR
jgi:hypothetical protein